MHGIDQVFICPGTGPSLNEPSSLGFIMVSPEDSFEPKFHEALMALAKFESARLEAILTSKSRKVVAVEFGSAHWKDPRTTAMLAWALLAGRDALFHYRDCGYHQLIPLKLTLNDGSAASFSLYVPVDKGYSWKPGAFNPQTW